MAGTPESELSFAERICSSRTVRRGTTWAAAVAVAAGAFELGRHSYPDADPVTTDGFVTARIRAPYNGAPDPQPFGPASLRADSPGGDALADRRRTATKAIQLIRSGRYQEQGWPISSLAQDRLEGYQAAFNPLAAPHELRLAWERYYDLGAEAQSAGLAFGYTGLVHDLQRWRQLRNDQSDALAAVDQIADEIYGPNRAAPDERGPTLRLPFRAPVAAAGLRRALDYWRQRGFEPPCDADIALWLVTRTAYPDGQAEAPQRDDGRGPCYINQRLSPINSDPDSVAAIFTHEVGHLLGFCHSPDPESLMAGQPSQTGQQCRRPDPAWRSPQAPVRVTILRN